MPDKKLSTILFMLVPHVIAKIAVAQDISFSNARAQFYESDIYSMLEDDDTKLWHLSPTALSMLYESERVHGSFEVQEEAVA